MSKKDRTDIMMYIEYENPYEQKKIEEDVYIPTEIFCEAFRKWSDSKMVGVDATDTSIVNFISDLDAWRQLEDDDDFIEICKELYYKSHYFEDDKDEFIDDYESLHELGVYAPDDEEI